MCILSPNLVSCNLKHELHTNYCLHALVENGHFTTGPCD